MGFYVPWVINGSKHAARLFRRTFQQQAGTGSGVDRPGDLKVQALSVPGTGFRIAPGGGVAQSRDTAASSRESYGPILDAQFTVMDVPGTGSQSTRRDLVILEITDPEMESVEYPSPTTAEGWQDGDNFVRVTVIPDVDSLVPVAQRPVKSLDQLKTGAYANVTGVTLAAINWPKSTATIANTMIEDLRVVHRPQEKLSQRSQQMAGEEKLTAVSPYPAGTTFPLALEAAWEPILIPDWATEMVIRMTWAQVRFPPGNQAGRFWVQVGRTVDPDRLVTPYNVFDTAATADPKTESWIFSATVKVPPVLRGTMQKFFPRATNNAAAPESARPSVFWGGSMDLDVIFRGAAA